MHYKTAEPLVCAVSTSLLLRHCHHTVLVSVICSMGHKWASKGLVVLGGFLSQALREFLVFLYRSLVGEKAMNRLENKKLFPK